ncbi:hypothetical protein AXK57_19785 [Tsukamurella pulmonis]|uniref:DUF7336 domain-containing protein n=1 Tax=Tsukamurella pulmonis TaxID=47312 RepID=UPI000798633A|nr:hypothetical protein [Tsukamurella pulmonis]KXP12193.1 hypothetical protein AXK57_19785 [Tsukamurella pulmonis]
MSLPTEVYVVTSGCYSDYKIRRVFLDRDEAEKYVTAMNATADDWRACLIEPWPLGRPRDDEDEGYRTAWEWTPNDGFEEDYGAWGYDVPDGARSHIVESGPGRVVVAGSSEEHVRKAIFDEVARIRAEQEGVA